MALHWVRASHYRSLAGDKETDDAIEGRLRNGVWIRDVHARRPDGSKELWINLQAVNDWAAGKPNAATHGRMS